MAKKQDNKKMYIIIGVVVAVLVYGGSQGWFKSVTNNYQGTTPNQAELIINTNSNPTPVAQNQQTQDTTQTNTSDNTFTPTKLYFCTDTDTNHGQNNGNNPWTKGTCTDNNGANVDSCTDNCKLTEYYCDSGICKRNTLDCCEEQGYFCHKSAGACESLG